MSDFIKIVLLLIGTGAIVFIVYAIYEINGYLRKSYIEVLRLKKENIILQVRCSEVLCAQKYITDHFDYIVNLDPCRGDEQGSKVDRIIAKYKAEREAKENE
jgi:hypothetical protein